MQNITNTPCEASDATLSKIERERLKVLEITIDGGMQTFIAVGNALLEINEQRLYRAEFPTFERYCYARWGLKRQRAYELMGAADIANRLSEISDIAPERESHIAPLGALSEADQPEVWKEAVETAPKGKITARHVEAVVARRVGPAKKEVEWDEGEVPDPDPAPTPSPAVTPAPRPALPKKPAEPLAVDREGHPIHDAAMAAIFAEREAFQSLARELSRLKASFAELADGSAGAVATTYVKQFNAAIDTAHDTVRFSLPHSLCPYCGGRKCQKCSQNGWMSETAWKSVPADERGQA